MPVVKQIPVRRAIYAGTNSRSEYFWNWIAEARRQRIELVTMRAGEDWQVVGKFRWRVLNPPVGVNYRRSDDNSLVLLLEYGATRVLLTSDIGQSVERRLVAGGADLRAQILVKGRHGLESSGTDEFLDAVQPVEVVQAVGAEPKRYLEPDLRERLRRRGIRLYRTDETGAVTIRLRETGYEIQTYLGSFVLPEKKNGV